MTTKIERWLCHEGCREGAFIALKTKTHHQKGWPRLNKHKSMFRLHRSSCDACVHRSVVQILESVTFGGHGRLDLSRPSFLDSPLVRIYLSGLAQLSVVI